MSTEAKKRRYVERLSKLRRALIYGRQGYLPGTAAARNTLLKILDNFGETDKHDYKERDIVLLIRPNEVPAMKQYFVELLPQSKQNGDGTIRGRLHGIQAPFHESDFKIGDRGEILKFIGLPRSFRKMWRLENA